MRLKDVELVLPPAEKKKGIVMCYKDCKKKTKIGIIVIEREEEMKEEKLNEGN